MPIGIVLIILAAIIFGTMMVGTIARSFFKYMSSQNEPEPAPESLTTSELYTLIEEAVAEATQPLAERVAALEARAPADALPLAHRDLLDATDGYEATPEAVVPEKESVR